MTINEIENTEKEIIVDDSLVWHFTHNDGDGLGCALVADKHLGEYSKKHIHTVFSPIPVVEEKINEMIKSSLPVLPKIILISDLSISVNMAKFLNEIMKKYNNEWLLVDHHPTNNLSDMFSRCFVTTDTSISAAINLDDILSHGCKSPRIQSMGNKNKLCKIIKYISDYDTWEWKNNPNAIFYKDDFIYYDTCMHEDLITKVINSLGINITYELLSEHLMSDKPTLYPKLFEELYVRTIKARDNAIKNLSDEVVTVRDIDYGILRGYTVVRDNFINDKAHYILENTDVDMMISVDSITGGIHVRSKESCDIDCGKYCEEHFSGGGHKHAAGGRLSAAQYDAFINFYYSKIIERKYDEEKSYKK